MSCGVLTLGFLTFILTHCCLALKAKYSWQNKPWLKQLFTHRLGHFFLVWFPSVSLFVCLSTLFFPQLCVLRDSVPTPLFHCSCVSNLIADLWRGIDLREKITKLSNCFIDWLSFLSPSFCLLPFLVPSYSPWLHSLPPFYANFLPLIPLLPNPHPPPFLLCCLSPLPCNHRPTDLSSGEVWLRRGCQQMCFIVMAMRRRKGLRERGRRGAVRRG